MFPIETSKGFLPEHSINHLIDTQKGLTPERAKRFFTQCQVVYGRFVKQSLKINNLDFFPYVDPADGLLCAEFLSTLPERSELYINMYETSSGLIIDTEVMLSSPEDDPVGSIINLSASVFCYEWFPHLQGLTVEVSSTTTNDFGLTYDRNGSLCGIRISDPQLLEELNLPEKSFLTITDPTDLSIAVRYLNDKFGDIIFSNPIDAWGTIRSMTQGFYRNVDGQIIPMIIYK